MRVIFLGTGTSHGVPVIGCDCPVCRSQDPRDRRTRSSLFIREKDTNLLIDTANEFRLQALKAGIRQVDGVLYTHCHADHVFGLDDLRVFSQRSGRSVPIYGNCLTMEEICQVFGYVFRRTQEGGGKPQIDPISVSADFSVGDLTITPIPIYHGQLPILGYRIGNLAYVTDCSEIPAESEKFLVGLDVLILGVIRSEPHPTHMHVSKALEVIAKFQPKRAYFTHISHRLAHQATNARLPENVELAYDGLEIIV